MTRSVRQGMALCDNLKPPNTRSVTPNVENLQPLEVYRDYFATSASGQISVERQIDAIGEEMYRSITEAKLSSTGM